MKLDRDRLIRAREMLGYGVEKTAEEAGVSKNSVLRAEHEEDIRPGTARKIAAALGVAVADLLEADTPKGQAPPPLEAWKRGAETGTPALSIRTNLDVVDAVRDAILVRQKREKQMLARSEESRQPQTVYFSSGTPGSSEDLERSLREQYRDPVSFGEMMFSALWDSVRRHVKLEEENARLKEELAEFRRDREHVTDG